MAEQELWVDGMSCAHCERAVSAELSAVAAVEDVRVNVSTGRVLVTHDGTLSRADVERAIDDAGYELRSSQADDDG